MKQSILACGAAGVLAMIVAFGPVRGAHGQAAVPEFDHIVVIMMENHSLSEIVGSEDAPFMNSLAASYPLAANYFGVTHPSLPNYMTVSGGDTFFTSDCSITAGGCTTPAPSIVDSIEASGRTWKAYMEDMPVPCLVGDDYPVLGRAPAYVEKHNAFIHHDGIRTNPTRCNQIVPYAQITEDLAALPNFVWITPNMCNDMHDTCNELGPIKTGDDWLSTEVPRIQNSPSCAAPHTCLIVVTFDEGAVGIEPPEDNHAFTVFVKPGARPPDSSTPYNHYSLLRTIEESWGLVPLTANDAAAAPMADMF